MGWDAGKGQTETKTKNKIKQNRKQQNIKNKHKRCYLNDAIFFAFCEFANIIRRSFRALYFCFASHTFLIILIFLPVSKVKPFLLCCEIY